VGGIGQRAGRRHRRRATETPSFQKSRRPLFSSERRSAHEATDAALCTRRHRHFGPVHPRSPSTSRVAALLLVPSGETGAEVAMISGEERESGIVSIWRRPRVCERKKKRQPALRTAIVPASPSHPTPKGGCPKSRATFQGGSGRGLKQR